MILIKGGRLVTAEKSFTADILIEGETIKAIEMHIDAPGAEVIDASGLLVMPGGIDPHVHLDLEMFDTVSSDDHYTGHKAAAFGGSTTVMVFIVQEPDIPLAESVAIWRTKAEKAAIDFGFHMNI
ncbi:MAG TPA: hypothetical protein VJ965_07970, partial [Anaerolineales bacterium]|nr:hypothetical protein [Anaerolineales bacterium]